MTRPGRGPWRRYAPIFLILAIGGGLRTAQYFGQVDMWHDELAVARNVEDRGLTGLVTRPLDHEQVAPVGFLAMLEATTAILGVTGAGLRLWPWLLGLASLVLFWRVASRFTEGTGLLVALALFAVSPALIWYGASAKPYGGDVTMSLLLAWLALWHLGRPEDGRRGLVAGGIGGLALLFSFPAVPTAALLAALLVVAWARRRPRSPPRPMFALVLGWGAGIAAAGFVASGLVSETTDAFMRNFHAGRFPPAEVPEALVWAARSLWEVFAHSLVFFPPSNAALVAMVAIPLLLGAIGLARLIRRGWPQAAILLVPPVAGLMAAALQLLPFGQRLGLHATWSLLVLAGGGLDELAGIVTGRWRWMHRAMAAVTAAPLVLIVLLAARPPYQGPSGRDVVEELAGQVREGDRIYVYTQGRHDMAFYGGRAGLESWIEGGRHPDDPRAYLRELDALRGASRAWFFWVDLDASEHPGWIRDYLGVIGTERQQIWAGEPGSSGAALFDLSDPERLDEASAESFPLPTPGSISTDGAGGRSGSTAR